jgi:hypothetical protein
VAEKSSNAGCTVGLFFLIIPRNQIPVGTNGTLRRCRAPEIL